jgi:FKBP-type peptidyl-prolyl cis-trans isomerase
MHQRNEMTRRLLAVLIVAVFALMLAACQSPTAVVETSTPTQQATETALPADAPFVLEGADTTASGLQFLQLTPGEGAVPNAGDIITMHYIVTLPDGTELANTYTEGIAPSTVWRLGRLLPGWEEAIGMMNVGEKAKVVIPPALAFGEQGNGGIPPNTPLVIEMELISANPAPVPATVAEGQMTTSSSGLEYYELEAGSGAEAVENGGVSTLFKIWV